MTQTVLPFDPSLIVDEQVDLPFDPDLIVGEQPAVDLPFDPSMIVQAPPGPNVQTLTPDVLNSPVVPDEFGGRAPTPMQPGPGTALQPSPLAAPAAPAAMPAQPAPPRPLTTNLADDARAARGFGRSAYGDGLWTPENIAAPVENPEGTGLGRAAQRGWLRTLMTPEAATLVDNSTVITDAMRLPSDISTEMFLEYTGLPYVPRGLDISTPELALQELVRRVGPERAQNFQDVLAIRLERRANALGEQPQGDSLNIAPPRTVEEATAAGAEAATELERLRAEIQNIPFSPAAARLQQTLAETPDEVWATLGAMGRDLLGTAAFLGETSAESAPQLLATTVGAIATRNPAVVVAMTGGGTVVQEYGTSVDEFLQENEVSMSTPAEALDVLQNSDLIQRANERGAGRALTIAAFEMLGMGLNSVLPDGVAGVAADTVLQGATGAGGEMAARAVTGQEQSAQEALIEGLAEVTGLVIEGPAAAYASQRGDQSAEAAPQPPMPQPQPPMGTPQAPTPPVVPADAAAQTPADVLAGTQAQPTPAAPAAPAVDGTPQVLPQQPSAPAVAQGTAPMQPPAPEGDAAPAAPAPIAAQPDTPAPQAQPATPAGPDAVPAQPQTAAAPAPAAQTAAPAAPQPPAETPQTAAPEGETTPAAPAEPQQVVAPQPPAETPQVAAPEGQDILTLAADEDFQPGAPEQADVAGEYYAQDPVAYAAGRMLQFIRANGSQTTTQQLERSLGLPDGTRIENHEGMAASALELLQSRGLIEPNPEAPTRWQAVDPAVQPAAQTAAAPAVSLEQYLAAPVDVSTVTPRVQNGVLTGDIRLPNGETISLELDPRFPADGDPQFAARTILGSFETWGDVFRGSATDTAALEAAFATSEAQNATSGSAPVPNQGAAPAAAATSTAPAVPKDRQNYMLERSLTPRQQQTLAANRDSTAGDTVGMLDNLARRARGENGNDTWIRENAERIAADILDAVEEEGTADLAYPSRDEDTGEYDYDTGHPAIAAALELEDTALSMGVDIDTIDEMRGDPENANLDRMDPDQVFPEPEQTVNIDARANAEGFISEAEAEARVQSWKDAAAQIGSEQDNSNKVVISLFDYTGAWSQPWRDAGYQVLTLDIKTGQDILSDELFWNRLQEYREAGLEIVGVLSACPCTTFAGSGSRWWAGRHDINSKEALEATFGSWGVASGAQSALEYNIMLFEATRDVIEAAAPTTFHALENPIGRIAAKTGLPDPSFRFHPHNFGDPYTKRTQIWGDVNTDLPTANVEPEQGSKMQNSLRGNNPKQKEERSVTPEGFAYAFFMAHDPTAREMMENDALPQGGTAQASPAPADADVDADVETDVETGAIKDNFNDGTSGELTSASGPTTREVSYTQGETLDKQAWVDAGLTPEEGRILPPAERKKVLADLLTTTFGFARVITTLPGKARLATLDAVDQMLAAYRSLRFMSNILQLPISAMGLQGRLTLTLERDRGRYLGMYSPGNKAIHMPGRSNSFAHEWMHALDHFLRDQLQPQAQQALLSQVARNDGLYTADSLQAAFVNLIHKMFYDDADLALRMMELETKAQETLKRGPNAGQPTQAAIKAQEQLARLAEGASRLPIKPTAYRAQSAAYGGGGSNYWSSVHEMLARGFEAYLAHHLSMEPGANAFITKGDAAYLSDADDRLAMTFPKDEERARIFDAFDQLFDQLRTQSVLGLDAPAAKPTNDNVFKPVHVLRLAEVHRGDPILAGTMHDARRLLNGVRKMASGAVSLLRSSTSRQALATGMREQASTVADIITYAKDQFMFFLNTVRGEQEKLIRRAEKAARPSLQAISDRLMSAPGVNRTVKETMLEESKARMKKATTHLQETIVTSGILGNIVKRTGRALNVFAVHLPKADNDAIRQMLLKGKSAVPNATEAQVKVADALRYWMDKAWRLANEAGMSVGYVENQGYLPRTLRVENVEGNREAFIDKATTVYEIVFDDEVSNITPDDLLDMSGRIARRSEQNVDRGVVTADIQAERKAVRKADRALAAAESDLRVAKQSGNQQAIQQARQEVNAAKADLNFAMDKLKAALRTPWAADAAANWRERIINGSSTTFDSIGPDNNFTKSRLLPPEADDLLADFYDTDVLSSVMSYLVHVYTRSAYTSRFGKTGGMARLTDVTGRREVQDRMSRNPGKYNTDTPEGRTNIISDLSDVSKDNVLEMLLAEAGQQGATNEEIAYMRGTVETIAGRRESSVYSKPMNFMASATSVIGTSILLLKTPLLAPTEAFVAGLKTGRPRDSFRVFLESLRELNRWSPTVKERATIAKLIGLISAPLYDIGIMSRATVDPSQFVNGWTSEQLSRYHRATGLAQITNATRRAAMTGGTIWMADLLIQHRKLSGLSDPSRRQQKRRLRIERNFREHGVSPEQLPELADWFDQIENGLPTEDQIDSPMGQVWETAIRRFVDQTIQEPNQADKPMAASTAMGRIVYTLTSFIYSFYRNVHVATYERMKGDYAISREVGEGKVRSALDAASLQPMFFAANFGILIGAHFVTTAIREFLFNRDWWEEQEEEGDLGEELFNRALMRSGVFGPYEQLNNMRTGLRYERDLTTLTAGAYVSMILNNVGTIAKGTVPGMRNSPNTTTAERRAVEAAYDLLVVPTAETMLSRIPASAGVSWTARWALMQGMASDNITVDPLNDMIFGEE